MKQEYSTKVKERKDVCLCSSSSLIANVKEDNSPSSVKLKLNVKLDDRLQCAREKSASA